MSYSHEQPLFDLVREHRHRAQERVSCLFDARTPFGAIRANLNIGVGFWTDRLETTRAIVQKVRSGISK